MSVFIATSILHTISLLLCVPFAYVQSRLRNITLLALIAPVALLHSLTLFGFVVWGKHINAPVWACVLRKAVYVYAAQGVFLMTAVVMVRLWLGTYGYLPADKQRLWRLETYASLGGLILPLAPALLASLPQVITQDYHPDLLRLNKCSAGYIRSWQVFASGAAFSVPAALVSLLALGAICWRLGFLIRYRDTLLPMPDSRQALRDVASTLLRVLLFCITIGVTELYYIIADFLVVYQIADTALGQSTREQHGNHFGHVMLSLWGLLIFLIFSTSQQSRWILRTTFRRGAFRSRCHTHESKPPLPDYDPNQSLARSARPSQEGEQLVYAESTLSILPYAQSSSAPDQAQYVPHSPSSIGSTKMSYDHRPVQRSYLTTPGLPTISRCTQEMERDRAFTTRTGKSTWSSPDMPMPRRPVAGEMLAVNAPMPAYLRQSRKPLHELPTTDMEVPRAASLSTPREHVALVRQSIVRSDTIHAPYSRPTVPESNETHARTAESSSTTDGDALTTSSVLAEERGSSSTNSSEQRRLWRVLDEMSSSGGSYVDIVLRTQPVAPHSDGS